MIERKEMCKLVIMTLEDSSTNLKASELYSIIREERPSIFKQEKVKTFRSFVKVINQFPEIEQSGYGVKKYGIARR